ncbi:hypothetical protein LTR27_003443 [Elasticomyces elasticus]|nr:hypothetical protein LTR27_003443 [Elasticomyces elasticus]
MATFHDRSIQNLVQCRRALANAWDFTGFAGNNASFQDCLLQTLGYFVAILASLLFFYCEAHSIIESLDLHFHDLLPRRRWQTQFRGGAYGFIGSLALPAVCHEKTPGQRFTALYVRLVPAVSTYGKLIIFSMVIYGIVCGIVALRNAYNQDRRAWALPQLEVVDITVALLVAFAAFVMVQDRSTGFYTRLALGVAGYTVVYVLVLLVVIVFALTMGIAKAVAADLYWPEGLEKRGMESDGVGNAAVAVRGNGGEEAQVARVE